MIKIVRNDNGISIARADIKGEKINLSLGVGAYQFTELTTEQARELALNLMVLASKIADEETA